MMCMKTMAKTAAVVAACGLAASVFLGVPVMSLMRSGGDAVMAAAGSEVTADSVRDLIEQSRKQIAAVAPAIERCRRQMQELEREERALRQDEPMTKARLERMMEVLAGSGQTIVVNGSSYPRVQVEADADGTMMEYQRVQERLKRLPAERRAMEQQVVRLERERAESWTRLAAMEREAGELESRGRVAAATREAGQITVREASSLGRQMDRLREMVEAAEAMNTMSGSPGALTSIDWSNGQERLAKARALGLNVPAAAQASAPHAPMVESAAAPAKPDDGG